MYAISRHRAAIKAWCWRVLNSAPMQVPFEIDGNEARVGADVFVAGHGSASEGNTLMTLDIPNGSPQNARMNKLFLQLR